MDRGISGSSNGIGCPKLMRVPRAGSVRPAAV
jgi:hypothetical protein